MNENENIGFEDFETALFGDDYQFDGEDGDFETEETDDTEDGNVMDDSADASESEDESDTDSDEDETEEADDDSEESVADGEGEGDSDTNAGQTFTIKVNKEERQVTLEEMTALAQMGADYGRVKDQNAKHTQTIQELQAQLQGYNTRKPILDILDIVSEKTGTSLEQLAESLYLSLRNSSGVSADVAREELKSAKLEKELNGYKTQQTKAQQQKENAETRAQRELEAFQKEYPDVQLTKELVDKLTPEMKNGSSLSAAYRKLEKAQADARIADLERQLAAKKQNSQNKQSSPGSQKDRGGRRNKTDYEEFEKALFG
jgi:hypothetical protein